MSNTVDFNKEFAGKRAVVTGGSRGIGEAIAQKLIDGGAKVVVTARSSHEQTPKDATFISGDIRSEAGVKAFADEALKVLGGIDILVNNAGASKVFLGGISTIPDEEWVDSLNINFLSAVRVTNAFLPALKEAGAGSIVNITSGTSAPPAGILLHYWAAKSALNSYSRGIAQELAPSKIRVNVISPGLIATPGANDVQAVLVKALGIPAEQIFKVPMGRIGQPEELAEVAAFLLSERASYVTGQIYHVDGGIN